MKATIELKKIQKDRKIFREKEDQKETMRLLNREKILKDEKIHEGALVLSKLYHRIKAIGVVREKRAAKQRISLEKHIRNIHVLCVKIQR
jgi:hypothetical protein